MSKNSPVTFGEQLPTIPEEGEVGSPRPYDASTTTSGDSDYMGRPYEYRIVDSDEYFFWAEAREHPQYDKFLESWGVTDEDVNPVLRSKKRFEKKLATIEARKREEEERQQLRRIAKAAKAKKHANQEGSKQQAKQADGAHGTQSTSQTKKQLSDKSNTAHRETTSLRRILTAVPQNQGNRGEMAATMPALQSSSLEGRNHIRPVRHDLASNPGVRSISSKGYSPKAVRSNELSHAVLSRGPADYLAATAVAGITAVAGAAAHAVRWVWKKKYAKSEETDDEDEDEDMVEDGDVNEVEEREEIELEKRGIRLHARHWGPETLTHSTWSE